MYSSDVFHYRQSRDSAPIGGYRLFFAYFMNYRSWNSAPRAWFFPGVFLQYKIKIVAM